MATLEISPAVAADDGQASNTVTFDTGFRPKTGFENNQRHYAWFRFPAATIPVGATIDVAYLTLEATTALGSGTVNSTIYAVNEDDHAAPTTLAEFNTDHGIHTTASTAWSFTNKGSGSFQTPSITAVIQEIVDRGGWASGQDIGIHVDDDGSTGDGIAQNFDDVEGTTEAVLHVEYTEAVPDTPDTRRIIRSPRYGITRSVR